MNKISVGKRLYLSVLGVFILFAVAFIVFQQVRERQYKLDLLEARLEGYNERIEETFSELNLSDSLRDIYVASHIDPNVRMTFIAPNGQVFYDNARKIYSTQPLMDKRPEVLLAKEKKPGIANGRSGKAIRNDTLFVATYYPQDSVVIRSGLPIDNTVSEWLSADSHFIIFAISAMALLTFLLWRFIRRLGSNITKLRIFAYRADHNESLDTEDLKEFPDDELGEIAERIIKLYKRLQSTRKEQDMLKRQLTQNVAHELKTPVASIQGYMETIISNPNMDPKTKDLFLERCYSQSQRLSTLLRDISTLNRLDDGSDMIDFYEVNISEIMQNIVKDTALQVAEKQMTLRNLLPTGITVLGNQGLLYSIFRNLTDNAIAYAGVGTTITVQAQDLGDSWHFSFWDNGVGVPAQDLPRLFERFYRVDKGRSRKLGGTGLGLAIVKNAVKLHGGTIRVSNRIEGGLQFDFDIAKGE